MMKTFSQSSSYLSQSGPKPETVPHVDEYTSEESNTSHGIQKTIGLKSAQNMNKIDLQAESGSASEISHGSSSAKSNIDPSPKQQMTSNAEKTTSTQKGSGKFGCDVYTNSFKDFIRKRKEKEAAKYNKIKRESNKCDDGGVQVGNASVNKEVTPQCKPGEKIIIFPEPVKFAPGEGLPDKLYDYIDDCSVGSASSTDLTEKAKCDRSSPDEIDSDREDADETISNANDSKLRANKKSDKLNKSHKNSLSESPEHVNHPDHSGADLSEFSGYLDLKGVDENELEKDPQCRDLMAAITATLE